MSSNRRLYVYDDNGVHRHSTEFIDGLSMIGCVYKGRFISNEAARQERMNVNEQFQEIFQPSVANEFMRGFYDAEGGKEPQSDSETYMKGYKAKGGES